MKEIKFANETTIGLPFTPSVWEEEPRYEEISRVKMSCGGGMGGASWYEYVKRVDDIPPNSIVELHRIDGGVRNNKYPYKVKVNTNFVVAIEDFTLVTLVLYDQREIGNGFKYYKCLVRDGDKIKLVDDYQDKADRLITLWSGGKYHE